MSFWPWSSSKPLSPQSVRYDVHSHLLPGVDDGVPDSDEALACLRLLSELGYVGAVITPHIHADGFDNTESFLRERFSDFAPLVAKELPGFSLQIAAEYMLDDQFLDRLYDHPDQLLRFGPDQSLLLIEMSTFVEPVNLNEVLDECRRHRIQPIMAHVERYLFVTESDKGPDRLREWRERGALIQVNLGSFADQYGSKIRKAARRLWAEDVVDLLGSDMHRSKRAVNTLPKAWKYLRSRRGKFDEAVQAGLFDSAG